MRAAVMRQSKLVVEDVPDPEPRTGEALVRTIACGICGSDLHALKHADLMADASREAGVPNVMDPSRDIIMGHEFSVEILDYGPDTAQRLRPGTRAVCAPILLRGFEIHALGYSNDVPGGYAERMVLQEPLLVAVPDGLSSEKAALTEPMAVGIHAVARARAGARDSAIVIGCGPVGLAVIAGLRLEGVEPIIAADFSPLRRVLAEQLGAHVVVDPNERSAFTAWSEVAAARPPVVFECVGVPGVISGIIKEAPRHARIVVVGVSMEKDHFKPMVAVVKEVSLQFCLGYSTEEFEQTLHAIADGRIDVEPLITGRVGLEALSGAFDALAQPDRHAKILVDPGQS
jgi:threonine dehydrogenase-like Zn-dependent dehydrogenase